MNAKVKCKTCKRWVPTETAIRQGLSSFCSQECLTRQVYSSNLGPPSKAPCGFPKPKSGVSEQTRAYVLDADGQRCRLCGKAGPLILHHVEYRSGNTTKPWLHSSGNLISLHNEPCHLSIVHKDKKRFKPLLLGLIWLRETNGERMLTAYDLEQTLERK